MIPSVRSRLAASGFSFIFGFVVANAGLILIDRPDQVVWIVVGAMFMVTGALGVLIADSRREFSWWSILGAQFSVLAVAIPILWLFSMTVGDASSLWPQDPNWQTFTHVWKTSQSSALNTVLITAPSAAGGCVLGALAAVATVRNALPGRRPVRWLFLVALFVPAVILASPMATQAYAFGMHDQRRFLAVCVLAISLPLSWWIFDRVGRWLPWSLHDAFKADGATVPLRLWHFWARLVMPTGVGVFAIVFILTAGEVTLASAMSADHAVTVPAGLAGPTGGAIDPARAAATALWWLIPCLLVAAACHRLIINLFTRRTR